MPIPNIFANESGSVQASQLDANFQYCLDNTISPNDPNTLTDTLTMSGAPIDEAKGSNVASASSVNLNGTTGNYVVITGTATITSVTLDAGALRRVRAAAAFTWQDNALINVQGGANYTATAGDLFDVWGDDAGVVWVVIFRSTAVPGGTVAVTGGGTGLTSGTSGGILGFTASTTLASSVALTANALVLGGGAGATPTPLGSLGTTTTILHGNAAGAPSWSAVSLTADVSGTLPVANGGTGITSFGAGIATWLGTPSSANLAAAVTDETGTGALVFANSPTLVTPVIGAATGVSATVSGTLHAYSGTAIPAGGVTGAGIKISSTANLGIFFGSGAPTLTAAKGSLYLRTDGTTTNDRAYINTDAGSTWTALTTVA